jgi:hypothetical protein
MKHILILVCISFLAIPQIAYSQNANEAMEPTLMGSGAIDLLEGGTLDAWEVPSSNWYLEEESIVGQTGDKKLQLPEWLYTKQGFGDFEFTCELKLTGDTHRNTGIYYRVNTFLFEGYRDNLSFEAPSGYEFDAAYHNTSGKNFWGSLGDWYARKSLRIFPDQTIINQAYKPEKWNRMTIRARGNRLEYWINGIKILDYLDHDPKASREGVIGLQIHDGSVMKVEYRNLYLRPLHP